MSMPATSAALRKTRVPRQVVVREIVREVDTGGACGWCVNACLWSCGYGISLFIVASLAIGLGLLPMQTTLEGLLKILDRGQH